MPNPNDIVDLYAPCTPGSLMRALKIDGPGLFRIARRDAELYSVQIVSAGAWGRARVSDADLRVLWYQPSTFTGSFVLQGHAKDGIVVEIQGEKVNLTLNWREADEEMV